MKSCAEPAWKDQPSIIWQSHNQEFAIYVFEFLKDENARAPITNIHVDILSISCENSLMRMP